MAGKPFTTPAIRWTTARRTIPSGYVLGRVSTGSGDVELIPLDQLSASQIASGLIEPGPRFGGAQTALGWFFRGPMQPNKTYYGATSLQAGKFPGTGLTQYAYAETAPGINFSLGIYIEGTGLIATAAWTGTNKTGTITFSGSVTVPALARLYVLAPNLADGEIRNATILLNGDAL